MSDLPLSTVILREGQPVAFGSVWLTQNQHQYSQVEKELQVLAHGSEYIKYLWEF